MPITSSRLERVREAISAFSLLAEGEEVLVALSGGADSVFCLLALRELGYRVRAIHVNHGLRPTAKRDEEFVVSLCDSLGVPITVRRIKVEGKGSLEERAREMRYAVLKEEARRLNLGKVCLAHNLSDAYETALFNLSRGTGAFGLLIPPKSGVFVRPLILLWREEIREALREAGVGWVEDESNYDTRFSRNFIRLEVLPKMLQLFPDLPKRFRRTYILLNREREFLKAEVERYGRERVMGFAGLTFIKRENDYLTARVLSSILGVEPEKVERALSLRSGRSHKLGGFMLGIYKGYVVIYTEPPVLEERKGRFVWEDINMALKGDTEGVRVRRRRPGERIEGRRLNDLFNAYGVPPVLRDAHPIVERDGKVIWVPGMYGSPGSLRFVKLCPRRPYLFDVYNFLNLKLRNP